MKRKISEKLRAIELRKKGNTVIDIAKLLDVSKSSVSVWVRNVPLSKSAENTLLSKIKKGQLAAAKVNHARTLAIEEKYFKAAHKVNKALHVTKHHMRLMCAFIYWCEGAKDTNRIDFTNSDADLMKTFLKFFRAGFNVDESKFRVGLHLHEYHNTARQHDYWSKVTGIPKNKFIKPYMKPHTGKQVRKNYPGCASIRYHDADMARQIQAIAKAAFKLYQ